MANVYNVCVPLNAGGTLAVGTDNVYGFKVPSASVGGGITITDVHYASNAAIAAASAPVYECVYCGTDSAIDGTISTVLGSVAWTAGTVRLGTLSTVFIDADNYVMFKRMHTAANADEPFVTASVQYVMGK